MTPARTTVRLDLQVAGGDRAFAGRSEDPDPPQIADITWTRRQLTLEVQHQVSTRFRLGLALPFVSQTVTNNQSMLEVDRGFRMADAYGYVFWAPWEQAEAHDADPFFSLHNLQFVAGLSLPFGDERKGDAPAIHFAQTGSGSVDARLGVAYFGKLNRSFSLFTDANVLIDGGADTSAFRNGNLYALRLGGSFSPHRMVTLTVADETVIRWMNYQTGSKLAESGSEWNFLVGRLGLYPHARILVEGSFAYPLFRNVNFVQPVTNQIWSVAVGYRY